MKKLILLLLIPLFSFGQIQEDKKLHFIAGGMAGLTAYTATYYITDGNIKKSIISGVLFSALVGSAKEIYDSKQLNNKFDSKDLGATILGGITFTCIISIPLKHKKK